MDSRLPVKALFKDGRVLVPSREGANRIYGMGFGSMLESEEGLTLSPCDALYLLERGKIEVLDASDGSTLSFSDLLSRFMEADERIWTRYLIYRDLRSRGYVVRGGVGLGIDFQVYGKGEFGKAMPRYIVLGLCEGESRPLSELLKAVEESESMGRELKLAVLDRRGEVIYYTVKRMDPSSEEAER